MRQRYSAIAYVALLAATARPQIAAKKPEFDVASVKVADKGLPYPGALQLKGGPGTDQPGRITWGKATLRTLLMDAWGLETYRITGPAWIDALPGYSVTALLPVGTNKQEFRLMLQSLLTERFHLKLHQEMGSFAGYRLIAAPGGPKLTRAANPDAPDLEGVGLVGHDASGFAILPPGKGYRITMSTDGVYATFQNYTLTDFITSPQLRQYFRQSSGRPSHILGNSELSGRYDIHLKFDGRENAEAVVIGDRQSAVADSAESSGLPNIFRALERQPGLRLAPVKNIPLSVLVIDQGEKIPTSD